MSSEVTTIPPASGDIALKHFEESLSFETNCWDVHAALTTGRPVSVKNGLPEQVKISGHAVIIFKTTIVLD